MPRKEVTFILRMTYDEKEKLIKYANEAGFTMSEYIRSLIKGLEPRERPPKEFYDTVKELRRIGVNLNQLAKDVNTYGYVSSSDYKKMYDEVSNLILDLKKKYLYPKKIE